MESYTFTDPESGLIYRLTPEWAAEAASFSRTLTRELLRVVAERDRLKILLSEAHSWMEWHSPFDESNDQMRIRNEMVRLLGEPDIVSPQRIVALEAENARLRAEVAFAPDRVLEAVREGERAGTLAYLAARAAEAAQDGEPWLEALVKTWCDDIRTECHLKPAIVSPQQGGSAAGDERAAGEGSREGEK